MENTIKVRWQNWTGDTTENLVLSETPKGIFVESTIAGKEKENFTVTYAIACDTSWRARKFKMELIGKKEKLELESDGSGTWSDTSGVIERLSGAIDIDISATPFTNTLPIRRLKLKEKQSAEILAVYVTVPGLDVSVDRQRYTCVIHNKLYRYESFDSDFIREITVDGHGLVLMYPGLFKRI
jgi:hypothetical protein